METRCRSVLAALGALTALTLAFAPLPAFPEVNVNINIGPPPVVVHEPPELVVFPRTMVYFAPVGHVDLFFYRGRWWTRHEGRWFRSQSYNGPWVVVAPRYVPVEIVRVPRDYRTIYVREKHIPYGQLKRHWERREYERRKRIGEWKGWKAEKRERKVEKRERKEEKRERKEEKREHKGKR